ncbi:MAG: DUF192 domain-containing protein [Alphaproteobacteria bacterium]|nr:MAG: hypothetical protein B6I23_02040 [Rickettsiaceae bacterium 4572_127]
MRYFLVFLFLLGCEVQKGDVFFGDEKFSVEYATSSSQQQKGLMFRKNLCEKCGMLFDFGAEQEIRMWMKNTIIPLDMIFMNKDKKIIYIEKNTIPHSLKTIKSPIPAKYVLELNAGISQKYQIKIGMKMK